MTSWLLQRNQTHGELAKVSRPSCAGMPTEDGGRRPPAGARSCAVEAAPGQRRFGSVVGIVATRRASGCRPVDCLWYLIATISHKDSTGIHDRRWLGVPRLEHHANQTLTLALGRGDLPVHQELLYVVSPIRQSGAQRCSPVAGSRPWNIACTCSVLATPSRPAPAAA